jgi:hypothetical protein
MLARLDWEKRAGVRGGYVSRRGADVGNDTAASGGIVRAAGVIRDEAVLGYAGDSEGVDGVSAGGMSGSGARRGGRGFSGTGIAGALGRSGEGVSGEDIGSVGGEAVGGVNEGREDVVGMDKRVDDNVTMVIKAVVGGAAETEMVNVNKAARLFFNQRQVMVGVKKAIRELLRFYTHVGAAADDMEVLFDVVANYNQRSERSHVPVHENFSVSPAQITAAIVAALSKGNDGDGVGTSGRGIGGAGIGSGGGIGMDGGGTDVSGSDSGVMGGMGMGENRGSRGMNGVRSRGRGGMGRGRGSIDGGNATGRGGGMGGIGKGRGATGGDKSQSSEEGSKLFALGERQKLENRGEWVENMFAKDRLNAKQQQKEKEKENAALKQQLREALAKVEQLKLAFAQAPTPVPVSTQEPAPASEQAQAHGCLQEQPQAARPGGRGGGTARAAAAKAAGLPVLRTAYTEKLAREGKKTKKAGGMSEENKEAEGRRKLEVVLKREKKYIEKLRRLLGAPIRDAPSDGQVVVAGDWYYFLADGVESDDSDDSDYEQDSEEEEDGVGGGRRRGADRTDDRHGREEGSLSGGDGPEAAGAGDELGREAAGPGDERGRRAASAGGERGRRASIGNGRGRGVAGVGEGCGRGGGDPGGDGDSDAAVASIEAKGKGYGGGGRGRGDNKWAGGRDAAIAARVERALRRRKRSEGDGDQEEEELNAHPPFFKDESVHSVEHLKQKNPHRPLTKEAEGEAGVVTEEDYKPLFDRISEEPWDEIVIGFVHHLLPLLDPSLPAAEVTATVSYFFWLLCSCYCKS